MPLQGTSGHDGYSERIGRRTFMASAWAIEGVQCGFEPPHPNSCGGPAALVNEAGGHQGRASPPVELVTIAAMYEATLVLAGRATPCHKQRSRAVCGGQSWSLREGRSAGSMPLTWGGGGGRNCMACKRSSLYRPCRAQPAELSLVAEDRSVAGVRYRGAAC